MKWLLYKLKWLVRRRDKERELQDELQFHLDEEAAEFQASGLASADDRLPLAEVKTQNARIDQTIDQEITFARLCSAFAMLALAIACVGLYGAMSYNVARRTGEIGIRMALGAQRGRLALAGAVAMLVSAAILAGYLPARRASRIEPMTALRHE